MARVTVEDCIEHVENRFELVVLAAQRAKQISAGSPLTVERDNDKDAVVALREIADETVQTPNLREDLTASFQRRHSVDEFEATPFAGESEEEKPDEEVAELMAEESGTAPGSDTSEEETEEPVEVPEGMDFADEDVDIDD